MKKNIVTFITSIFLLSSLTTILVSASENISNDNTGIQVTILESLEIVSPAETMPPSFEINEKQPDTGGLPKTGSTQSSVVLSIVGSLLIVFVLIGIVCRLWQGKKERDHK
ncbi:hypothetical protein A5844_000915 [Enterococcus sp. 10A9_DIV0425]|uniref:Uncharacterized protein n=1 Tax=Candidatus Enterococcus wittei TaxID=1987383 RepID=A0A242JZE5_9ENTE|nr:LPXTG cell wall anchor domain-containing protein [Enterococcus sp. 10A9_DIV0425]OTP10781.1 hypothetical protein A5844_000915 [Enterococcus sp. 10A9_DIV0425]THE10784.1 LPXTG cell wall anchor domain-containing protein [Enterococcus hirae]